MREYIFRHVIDGGKPLAGQTLAAAISQVARSLPGFDQWCNHRNELEQKAAYWVRSVEASPYYHYGHGKKLEIAQPEAPAEPKINWNQQQTDNEGSASPPRSPTCLTKMPYQHKLKPDV